MEACAVEAWFQVLDVDPGQRLRFHFHVDLGVDMGRVQRHMAKPSADRVDVDASAQQMDGGRVPPDVLIDIAGTIYPAGLCRVAGSWPRIPRLYEIASRDSFAALPAIQLGEGANYEVHHH